MSNLANEEKYFRKDLVQFTIVFVAFAVLITSAYFWDKSSGFFEVVTDRILQMVGFTL